MDFLYRGRYSLPKKDRSKEVNVSHVGFHAAMVALADKYDIRTLMDFAVNQCKKSLREARYNMGELLVIAPDISQLMVSSRNETLIGPLETVIARGFQYTRGAHAVISGRIASLTERTFREAVRRNSDFAEAVSVSLASETSLAYCRCEECDKGMFTFGCLRCAMFVTIKGLFSNR